MKWGDRPALSLAQQYNLLKVSPISKGTGHLTAHGLVWNWHVLPNPLSREYVAELKYEKGKTPRVFIISPDLLKLANGRPLPHIYSDPINLCLYLPKAYDWMDTMRLDQTFIPWTNLWLFYFEEWLLTNEWKGGGQHPSESDTNSYNRRIRRAAH